MPDPNATPFKRCRVKLEDARQEVSRLDKRSDTLNAHIGKLIEWGEGEQAKVTEYMLLSHPMLPARTID